jgi:hypothetical protein
MALKILAHDEDRRPQDALDIRALLAVATEEDLADARRYLDLIADRGFHRERDLQECLQALMARFG